MSNSKLIYSALKKMPSAGRIKMCSHHRWQDAAFKTPRVFFQIVYTLSLSVMCLSMQGQDMNFSVPVKLGPHVNSASEELNPILSQNGKDLYFTRVFHNQNQGGAYAGMDIWMAERKGEEKWSAATNRFSSLNNKDNNAVIGIRSDNKVIYLINSYNKRSGIAFSQKVFNGWSRPETIEISGVNKNDFVGFYMSPTYDVLLISMNGDQSFGEEDLYVSLKDARGEWASPVNLGSTINTSGFEISPFLSKDKKRLYFASSGHEGYGDSDIFVAERLYNSWTVWSTPKNLGSKINSKGFDAYFTLAEDSTAIFSSNREGGLSDLYQCEFLGLKNEQLALKESLISEAKGILAELRGDTKESEYFIEFQNGSAEISGPGKEKLSELIKELNYQYYGQIDLVSFEGEGAAEDIHAKRLDNILNFLKISGISEEKIVVNRSKEMTNDMAKAMFDKAHGVLIIVSKTN